MAKGIIFNVPTTGHVNPSLPVVKELVQRGDDIIYYLTPAYQSKVEATGAQFRAYDNVGDDYFENLDGSNPPYTAQTLAQTSYQIMPQLIEIVQQDQPDYIIYDSMCPWGWIVAEFLEIPSVSSMSLLVLNPRMLLRSGIFPQLALLMLRSTPHLLQFYRIAYKLRHESRIAVAFILWFFEHTGDNHFTIYV